MNRKWRSSGLENTIMIDHAKYTNQLNKDIFLEGNMFFFKTGKHGAPAGLFCDHSRHHWTMAEIRCQFNNDGIGPPSS
jgi:hypothetical protein